MVVVLDDVVDFVFVDVVFLLMLFFCWCCCFRWCCYCCSCCCCRWCFYCYCCRCFCYCWLLLMLLLIFLFTTHSVLSQVILVIWSTPLDASCTDIKPLSCMHWRNFDNWKRRRRRSSNRPFVFAHFNKQMKVNGRVAFRWGLDDLNVTIITIMLCSWLVRRNFTITLTVFWTNYLKLYSWCTSY